MEQVIFDSKLLKRSPARVARVRRWIRALRGKSYKQGTGYLRIAGKTRKDDRWCCLGVMLDLDQPKGWVDLDESRQAGGDVIHKLGDEGNKSQMPGSEACRRYGLVASDMASEGGSALLANLNDRQKSFADIADKLSQALREALKA